jgi:TnpA family transposase
MTSIYRTAYPRINTNKKVTQKELEIYYSLTDDELGYIKKNIRGDNLRLSFAVQLKIFQHLNYFPAITQIPQTIISHIRKQLPYINSNSIFNYEHDSANYRHRDMIYQYLKITSWKKQDRRDTGVQPNPGRYFAIQTAYSATQTMSYTADVINVVIEELRNNSYELPPFDQLLQLVKHTRNAVNRKIFLEIEQQLSSKQKEIFEELLIIKSGFDYTGYNGLKQLPKKATVNHLKELIKHHNWLMQLGDVKKYVNGIPLTKLQQFAGHAKSLDASDMKKYTPAKRYALISCLAYHAQCRAKDSLATMFCKILSKMHKKANEKLEQLVKESKEKNKNLVTKFRDVLSICRDKPHDISLVSEIIAEIGNRNGASILHDNCTEVLACLDNQALYLLPECYSNKRSILFRLLDCLEPESITHDDPLIKAMHVLRENEPNRKKHLSSELDLSFAGNNWQKLISKAVADNNALEQRYLELCMFSNLANNLQSGDIFINGAYAFADYRESLLDMELCEKQLDEYCKTISIPSKARDFIIFAQKNLDNTTNLVDLNYPNIDELSIDKNGRPTLKKRPTKKPSKKAIWLAEEIKKRMPKRNILDILCNSHHYTEWADIFEPISGLETKIENPTERYILTAFAYGSALGPEQAVQHISAKENITSHMLSWINRRHVTAKMLDEARKLLINFSITFPLVGAWGDGTACAGDGDLQELREENLIAALHMRYQKRGGIAYHHIANNYIALFSTFIPCGVWEAVAIIEGLLKNESDLQPKKIHADTQGQSTIVFALAYLLGFKLMPRIRNWKDYNFYRPDKNAKYKYIDPLFDTAIDWKLIEACWQDMMQVVLSIKAGKISSMLLLRKLGSYSRKNKLYYALQELGRAIRTQFLLEYISDVEMRETVTETTNKVESYNRLSDWVSFGSETLVESNDEEEMEKAVKYRGLLTDAVILQNIIDITATGGQLKTEGHDIAKEDFDITSPYLTGHIMRFGVYTVDLGNIPKNVTRSVLW